MLQENSTNVVRLYNRQILWVYIGTTAPSGVTIYEFTYDPRGELAEEIGIYATYNGMYFETQYVNTEVTELKDSSSNLIHKIVTLTFNANGGTGGSSQVRTWNVENVIQPSNPTRTNYTFLGWATTSGATSPNVDFPFIAPSANTTYYAVWQYNPPATANPTIDLFANPAHHYEYRVKNNDTSTASIYAEHNDSTPDIFRGNIAYNSYTSYIDTGVPSNFFGSSITVYAYAVASGKANSSTVSVYMEGE